jgi:hypothetical protein
MNEVMKKRIYVAFFAGACVTSLIATGLWVKQTQQVRSREVVIKALHEQVEQLGQTVVDLRKELGEMREHQKRVAAAPGSPARTLPQPPGDLSGPAIIPLVPNGKVPAGQPFEFNGRTYYLTPLESGAGASNLVAK